MIGKKATVPWSTSSSARTSWAWHPYFTSRYRFLISLVLLPEVVHVSGCKIRTPSPLTPEESGSGQRYLIKRRKEFLPEFRGPQKSLSYHRTTAIHGGLFLL